MNVTTNIRAGKGQKSKSKHTGTDDSSTTPPPVYYPPVTRCPGV